jgi:hypothetical protein
MNEQLRQYAREFARLGGLSKSTARAAASRANGKLGGRPKKQSAKPQNQLQKSTEFR